MRHDELFKECHSQLKCSDGVTTLSYSWQSIHIEGAGGWDQQFDRDKKREGLNTRCTQNAIKSY
jgi:hypothetical protein